MKKKVIPFGSEEFFTKVMKLKVKPVSANSKVSKELRVAKLIAWMPIMAKNIVKAEDGSVYAIMLGELSDKLSIGELIINLGEFIQDNGLELETCGRLGETGYGAIVKKA